MEKEQIFDMVKAYYEEHHKKPEFKAGDRINYAERVYDSEELVNIVDSALDFWLTAGKYVDQFEKNLAEYLGVQFVSTVNSGSSANLVAFMALTSPLLGDRQIKRGDEVICVAAAFPTSVAPILQYGAVPVFVDVEPRTCDIDVSKMEAALSDKTKLVFMAHTLGNPFDIEKVKEFCDKHNLWLIEDNCDALGGEYTLNGKTYKTGTIGDIGTSSFYPAHQMTMGEGGAVYTDNPLLHKLIRSFRDWGRECVCTGGQDNSCGQRFMGQFGKLPFGYDHKYVYSHLGYNLKITEMQAAVGVAQLKKLPDFVAKRREHWDYLRANLDCLKDVLTLPEKQANANPCWFGFLMIAKSNKDCNRITSYLESHNIQTRKLFAGNIILHPCFTNLVEGKDYRVVGDLTVTNTLMNNAFWVGVYPGMTQPMMDEIIACIKDAVKNL